MAQFTEEDLNDLEQLVRDYKRRLRNVERASDKLPVRHPIFPRRTINVTVTQAQRAELNGLLNQAEAALIQKIEGLSTKGRA